LNKAVSRNLARFPDDFMLRLTTEELRDLKFQFGTSSWGGTRKPPRAIRGLMAPPTSPRRRIGFRSATPRSRR